MLDSNRMRRTHDNRTEETKQLHIGIGDTFVQVRRRWKTCIVEFNAAPEGNRIPSPKAVELPDFACVTSHRSSVDGASPVPLCARSRISASGVASRTFTGLVFLSHELSSTHLHFIRECLTGRSSCFAAPAKRQSARSQTVQIPCGDAVRRTTSSN